MSISHGFYGIILCMRTRQINIRLDNELYEILKSYAEETRRSMSQVLVDYILSLGLRETPAFYQLKRKQGSE